jgi:hypothetical protein
MVDVASHTTIRFIPLPVLLTDLQRMKKAYWRDKHTSFSPNNEGEYDYSNDAERYGEKLKPREIGPRSLLMQCPRFTLRWTKRSEHQDQRSGMIHHHSQEPNVQEAKKRESLLTASLVFLAFILPLGDIYFFYRELQLGIDPFYWSIFAIRGVTLVLNSMGVYAIWKWKRWGLICFTGSIILIEVTKIMTGSTPWELFRSVCILFMIFFVPVLRQWSYFK